MHPLLASLSWTPADLVNHLWQSSLIALALLLLMVLCARLSARTRLLLGWMALAKFALPFGFFTTFVTLLGGNPEHWLVSRVFTAPIEIPASFTAGPATTPAKAITPDLLPQADAALPNGGTGSSVAAELPFISALASRLLPAPSLLAIPAAVWLAGFTGLYGWWILGGIRLHRRILAEATPVSPEMAAHLAAAAAKAGVHTLPRCLAVQHGNGPALLGVFSPILTLPPGLENKLTPAELESVLLHEFIHLRRRDPLWLAVHVAAVSVLWFNPVAWLLSRWIRLETEKACDESVLELTGQPDTYARGILKVVHLALGLPEPHLLGAITPPVVSRVKNILRHDARPGRRWLRGAALAAGAGLLALGGGHNGTEANAAVLPPATDHRASVATIQAPVLPTTARLLAAEALEAVLAEAKSPGLEPSQPGASTEARVAGPSDSGAPATLAPHDVSTSPSMPAVAATDAPLETADSGGNAEPSPANLIPLKATAPADALAALDRGMLEISVPALRPADELASLLDRTPASTEVPAPPTYPFDFNRLEIEGVAAASSTSPLPDAYPTFTGFSPANSNPTALVSTQPSAAFAAFRPATPPPAEMALPVPVPGPVHSLGGAVILPNDLDRTPAVITRVGAVYPGIQRRQGIEGFVDVGFTVDAQGRVQKARVISSSQREFEQAALQAVMKWKFQPGRSDGRPIATNMSVVINFRLPASEIPSRSGRPDAVFAVANPASSSPAVAVPPESAVPVITFRVAPEYPADLKRQGVAGRVEVAFIVDAMGMVQNVRAINSSQREFEPAAMEAVQKWKFKPGRKDGEPVAANMSVQINFHHTRDRF